MSCLISTGRALSCFLEGGVAKVWLANYSDTATFAQSPTGLVTGATSANTAYYFAQDTEYAGVTFAGVHEQGNGAISKDVVLALKFIELDADLLTTLTALSKASLTAYVLSNSGTYYVIGANRPARVTASTGGLGTALSDMNGATLEITCKSANGIYVMNGALLGTSITVAN